MVKKIVILNPDIERDIFTFYREMLSDGNVAGNTSSSFYDWFRVCDTVYNTVKMMRGCDS